MEKKKKRKLKKSVIGLFIGLCFLSVVILIAVIMIKNYNYKQTYQYKLQKVGYEKGEIEIILENLKDDKSFLDELVTKEKEEHLIDLLKERYYLKKNLGRYLNYYKIEGNESLKATDVVALVNVHRDRDYYEEPLKTDMSKGFSILVNKYYQLDKNYVPKDLTNMSLQYANENNRAREEAYTQFRSMLNQAKEDGCVMVANSSYRSYDSQEEIYDSYVRNHGQAWADTYAAHPGHSEHQTGLAIDVDSFPYTAPGVDFDSTPEFEWMQKNAYKYGFILRYPKGKENITGYSYESWHYRYVGLEIAKEIQEKGITFDEYYAYYLEK